MVPGSALSSRCYCYDLFNCYCAFCRANFLSRGHPKWWFSKGIPPKCFDFRCRNYSNLLRFLMCLIHVTAISLVPSCSMWTREPSWGLATTNWQISLASEMIVLKMQHLFSPAHTHSVLHVYLWPSQDLTPKKKIYGGIPNKCLNLSDSGAWCNKWYVVRHRFMAEIMSNLPRRSIKCFDRLEPVFLIRFLLYMTWICL